MRRAWKRPPSLGCSPPSSIPKTHPGLVPRNLRQEETVSGWDFLWGPNLHSQGRYKASEVSLCVKVGKRPSKEETEMRIQAEGRARRRG